MSLLGLAHAKTQAPIKTSEGKKKLVRVANADNCIECHTCELECPYGAIKVFPPLGEEFEGME